MKLNLETVITDLEGKPILESEAPDAKPASLGSLLMRSLLIPMRGDEAMAGEEKVRLAVLAQRLHGAKTIEFTAEETSLLKDRTGKTYILPLVVMRIWKAIDPASVND